jgi:hypothetical protein
MPKITLGNPIKRRLPYRENTVEGILLFGKDNLYPQRMTELLKRSGTAGSCVRLFAKFVRGAGFVDKNLDKKVINVAGQTGKGLKREVIDDYTTHFGFAIHVDYNAFLQPVNPKVIKFDYCRYGLPDEVGNITKIVVSDDWAQEKNKTVRKRQRVDVFNPKPEVVMAQIERAGGLENYNGQILYVTKNPNQYPVCTFDEVVADVETDAQLSIFRETSVTRKFMADYIAEYPGEFETASEREDFRRDLTTFQGVENNGSIMLLENKYAPDKKITFSKLDVQDNDKLFEWTDNSAQTKIRKNYTQPAILVGDLIPGKLGSTAEIENSVNFYNMFTNDDRDVISEALSRVLSLVPGVNASTYDIQPLTWQMFVSSLGAPTLNPDGTPATAAPVSGSKVSMQDLNRILSVAKKFKDGRVTHEQALLLLKQYGFTPEEAQLFLQDAEDGLDGVE